MVPKISPQFFNPFEASKLALLKKTDLKAEIDDYGIG